MKLHLNIHPDVDTPSITIQAPTLSEEVQSVIQCVENLSCVQTLKGHHDDTISFIDVNHIISIKTANKQVIALTQATHYVIQERLYTLESQLPTDFIRISKSEIINLAHLKKLALEPNGLIKMFLNFDYTTYSSRRYLKTIKERLNRVTMQRISSFDVLLVL